MLKFIPGGREKKKVGDLNAEVVDLWTAEIDRAIARYEAAISERASLGLPPSGFLAVGPEPSGRSYSEPDS